MAKKFNAKYVAYLAVFAALSTIANIWSIPLSQNNFLSFVYIPCILAGLFLGMPAGFIVGLIGDVLGCLIAPKGAWLPLITLASSLIGTIPGFVVYIWKKFNPECLEKTLVRNAILWASLLGVLLICTSGLNTLATFLAYSKGKTFWAYLGVRLPTQFIVFAVNGVILTAITNIPVIRKTLSGIVSTNRSKTESVVDFEEKSAGDPLYLLLPILVTFISIILIVLFTMKCS